jgi:hypothetical protein
MQSEERVYSSHGEFSEGGLKVQSLADALEIEDADNPKAYIAFFAASVYYNLKFQ